jgi:hypothetical protein
LDHQRPSTKHPNPHLKNIIRKSKALELEIPKIKIREGLSEKEAFDLEVAFIAAIGRNSSSGPLVNLTDGGEGNSGWKHSPEWRAKMSVIMTGRPGKKGKILSPETIEKMRAAAKARSPELKAALGDRLRGKPLSEEHKAKLRAAKLGKKLSADHRSNIGKAHLGKKRSEQARLNMRRVLVNDPVSGQWIRRANVNDINSDGIGIRL